MQKNLDLLYYSVFVLDFMSHPSEKDIGDNPPLWIYLVNAWIWRISDKQFPMEIYMPYKFHISKNFSFFRVYDLITK